MSSEYTEPGDPACLSHPVYQGSGGRLTEHYGIITSSSSHLLDNLWSFFYKDFYVKNKRDEQRSSALLSCSCGPSMGESS